MLSMSKCLICIKRKKEKGSEDFVDLLLRLEREEYVVGNENLTRNHIKAILMVIKLYSKILIILYSTS